MTYRFQSLDRSNNRRYVLISDYGTITLTSPSGQIYALSNEFSDVIRLEFEIEKVVQRASVCAASGWLIDVLNQQGTLVWEEMK